MMIPEGLDKSISTAISLSLAGLAWWAHRREMAKEKWRITNDAQKQYAATELKEYAAQRDFGHIKRDLEQLKINTTHLSKEADQRLDHLERQFERFAGALEVLTELLKERNKV